MKIALATIVAFMIGAVASCISDTYKKLQGCRGGAAGDRLSFTFILRPIVIPFWTLWPIGIRIYDLIAKGMFEIVKAVSP